MITSTRGSFVTDEMSNSLFAVFRLTPER